MHSRGSSHRLSGLMLRSRISFLVLAMLSSTASLYIAGRLWQDSQNRIYLIKELDRSTKEGKSAVSVEESLKVVACRHQHKRLASLHMELAAARVEGFVGKYFPETERNHTANRKLVVIGILTGFDRKSNRDAIRKSWVPHGSALKMLEEEKGVVVRFVIGRSTNRGDDMDRSVDEENKSTNDFIVLDNHVETSNDVSKKTKDFFAIASNTWDAEFYAKVKDDVYINIDGLIPVLSSHLDQPRAYIGCMKSGEIFSELGQKWYEPDWWKFGDGKTYFRHASGETVVISRALAQFVSINRDILRTYAHDDVSIGSWFIGLDVKHVHEGKLCCLSWSSGAVCAAV